MVMADLSGFTALSERLARIGDEGAERLTSVINLFFGKMLRTAERYGGDTLTFGGDAILLLFEGEQHADRAVAASLAMLNQVGRAGAIDAGGGKVKIGMSVGAHSDVFSLAAAGLKEQRLQMYVLGRAGELTALSESHADRGQLAVSGAARKRLGVPAHAVRSGDYWLVTDVNARVPPGALPESSISVEQSRALVPFLPPYIGHRETANEVLEVVPVHRRVAVVFVNILGLNELVEVAGDEVALKQLQAYAAMLTRLAGKHRGFVVSSDIATKGCKLILTFGAPVAHEYAAANAARFALELNAELRDAGIDLQHRIGVNDGHVFAGEVGPAFRRQYTVMGDAVNLAARLMAGASPGEIYASRQLLDHAGQNMHGRDLPPMRVKGKEEPVAVCVLEEEQQAARQVHAWTESGRHAGRLFGRQVELESIAQKVREAAGGSGRAVLIEGDAGVGKTRLLEEALRAVPTGATVNRTACFEHLQAAPYTPWLNVLHAVLEVSPDEAVQHRTAGVGGYLERHLVDLIEFGSLLNPLLNLNLPPGQVVESLDAQARRQKLFQLMCRILAQSCADQPGVIVLEDLHWGDESSVQFTSHLLTRVSELPLLLLITARPSGVLVDLESAVVSRLVLDELTESESLAMVRDALGAAELPAEVGQAVYAKTKGNPLFLEEVVHSLQAPGVLERIMTASSVARAAELATLEIPDRVQGLLMSRIDRLRPHPREALKAAAVIGRRFDEKTLSSIDGSTMEGTRLGTVFDELLSSALVVCVEDGEERSFTFRHALVQDVAYECLPFSRRRELHERVARHLEGLDGPPDHPLLVHHYRNARNAVRMRVHAVRAAESSVRVYANREAVDYLALALDTLKGRTPEEACQRSRIDELMGDSLETMARHDEAILHFTRARRRWASPLVRRASRQALEDFSPVDDAEARDSLLCWKVAAALERGRSAYRRALRWLDLGERSLPRAHSDLRARLAMTRSAVLSRLGSYREAVNVGEHGVELARRHGDPGLQAYALSLVGQAYAGLGLLKQATQCDAEAVRLYEQAGDLYGLAISHGNLASDYALTGDHRSAFEQNETSLTLHARLGNTNGMAMQHQNMADMLLELGETNKALEHLQESLKHRVADGVSPQVTGFSLMMLAKTHLALGGMAAAEAAVREGREILESIGAEGVLLELDVIDGELRLVQGDHEWAERLARDVVERAQSMGAGPNESEALCLLGRALIAQGRAEEAVPGLQACVTLAEKVGSDFKRGQGLTALAEAQAACTEGDMACLGLLSEAIRLFETIGARRELEKALEVRERLAAST